MNDQLEVLKIVASRLGGAGIRYMVSGSTAMNYYAQPRMTRDIAVVVELQPTDVDRLVALFGADFSCDADEIREAIERKRMFNLIHLERVIKVDMVVRKDSAYRLEELSRRGAVEIDGSRIWLVSPEDLILSKLVWAKDSRSELQLRDVRNLLAAVTTLDWSYLERWATELSVSSDLAELRS